jgi:hypothetical protein
MMAIIREDDFVSRAAGEWRNLSERVIATAITRSDKLRIVLYSRITIREYNTILFLRL